MKVKIKKLNDAAVVPVWNNKSAGCDLSSLESYVLKPGERKLFKTGLSIAIPTGLYGRVAPRSGLAYKSGIDVMAGVIDEDYRGEVGVILINLGQDDKSIVAGDKIAQLIFENYTRCEFELENNLDETNRGNGGFGSTDKPKLSSTTTNRGFVLGNRTSIDKYFAGQNFAKIEMAKSYYRNYQGDIYTYEENGTRGLCVIDASGTILVKNTV